MLNLSFRKRAVIVMASTAALAVALAAPALAEGSFSSSITGAYAPFNSRTWTDNNNDATSTHVTFQNCNDQYTSASYNDHAKIQLTRETPWYQPDENKGQDTLYCKNTSDTAYFGRVSSGNYHFTIVNINGQPSGSTPVYARIDVGWVGVGY